MLTKLRKIANSSLKVSVYLPGPLQNIRCNFMMLMCQCSTINNWLSGRHAEIISISIPFASEHIEISVCGTHTCNFIIIFIFGHKIYKAYNTPCVHIGFPLTAIDDYYRRVQLWN